MNNQYNEAKQIFMNYCGSRFGMERDGYYDKYKKFKISKEQERIWIKELQNRVIDKINKNNCFDLVVDFCITVSKYYEISNWELFIFKLENLIPEFDTYTSLIIIESLVKTLKCIEEYRPEILSAINFKNTKMYIIDVLNKLLNNPITLADEYIQKLEHDEFNIFSETYSEDAILSRIKETLNEANSLNLI